MSGNDRILMINDYIHLGGGGNATFDHERRVYEKAGYDVVTFSHATFQNPEKTDKDIIHMESFVRPVGAV